MAGTRLMLPWPTGHQQCQTGLSEAMGTLKLPLQKKRVYGGVERAEAGHGDDFTGLDVEHQGGAAGRLVEAAAVSQVDGVPERLLGLRLHLGVDGRHQRVARLRRTAARHGSALRGPPVSIHLDLGHTVATAQPAVVRPLEPLDTDDVAGRVALEVLLFELIGRDLPYVPEHMRRQGAVPVRAEVVLLDHDSRESLRMLQDVRDDALVDVLLHDREIEADYVLSHDIGPRHGRIVGRYGRPARAQ